MCASPVAVVTLAGRVAVDVVHSNIAVGRIILGLTPPNRRSGFMTVLLDLTNRYRAYRSEHRPHPRPPARCG